MKTIKIEVMDIEATYNVPSSFEEARLLCPVKPDGTDPLLDRIVNQTLYHQVFGDFRSGLVDFVEKKKNFKRNGETQKNKDGKEIFVVTEKDSPFIKRALAAEAVTVAELAEELKSLAENAEYGFGEYLKSERRHAGPAKLPKEIENAVATAIANGSAPAIAAKLSQLLGRTVDGTNTQELGEAIRDHRKRLMDEAAARAKNEVFGV